MPANLSADYMAAEQRFKSARTPEEKLQALQDMLATIPKHKGTEKMQADLKKRISQMKKEDAQKPSGSKGFSVHVDKEGAGQIALAGLPNSGKSSLVARLTKANCEIGDFPFTTRKPVAGMMQYENIQIQLVDLPAISNEFMEFWVPNIVRNADRVLLVADIGALDPIADIANTLSILKENKIELVTEYVENSAHMSIAQKATMLVLTKCDLDPSLELPELIKEQLPVPFKIIPVSIYDEKLLDGFRRAMFESLNILRVYTKRPGKEPDLHQPFVLPIGSTVLDLARTIHKDFESRLRFARVWGADKIDGLKIQREYVLQDKDIIELNIA